MKSEHGIMVGGRKPMTCDEINNNNFGRKKILTQKLARETKCNCRSNHPKLPCTSVYTDDGKWGRCSNGSNTHKQKNNLNELNKRIEQVQEKERLLQSEIKTKLKYFNNFLKEQAKMTETNQKDKRKMESDLEKTNKKLVEAENELERMDNIRRKRLRDASADQKKLDDKLHSLKKKQEDADKTLKKTMKELSNAAKKTNARKADGVTQTQMTTPPSNQKNIVKNKNGKTTTKTDPSTSNPSLLNFVTVFPP